MIFSMFTELNKNVNSIYNDKIILIIIFKPYSRLMLSELIYQVLIKHTQNKDLAESYFFHNSSFYFRPLWTYEAEKKVPM